MFKKATRMGLRFQTTKGQLTVEDLWTLSLQQLNVLAKNLKRKLKEDKEEDFLDEKSEEDTITKLQFDIVLDILNTKKEEQQAQASAAENKAFNQKILGLIAQKQDEDLRNMSADELKALLK